MSVSEAMDRGSKLFNAMMSAHTRKQKQEGGGDHKWIDEIISGGTASDRIAGLAMLVQQDPLHSLSHLDGLVDLALKKEQRLALMAMDAVKDLLVTNLLPDRHLQRYASISSGKVQLSDRQATILWYENELADRVVRFVDGIERGMHDTIEYFKKKSMEVAAALLTDKAEQEARLLTMLVNKIGDPSGGVTTKAIELILGLARSHPAMKGVVLREIKYYLHRSKLKPRALYSGVICLCRIPLTSHDADVSVDMVDILASLFEKAVSEGEGTGRLLSALLNGINRAFPFIKDISALSKHVDALFRIAHGTSFSSSTQALLLISQIVLAGKSSSKAGDKPSGESEQMINRFYRALYAQLLTDQLSTRSQSTLFLNLLYRSLKVDDSVPRVIAFVKRLLVRATQCSASITAGILMLVSELCKSQPAVTKFLFEAKHKKDNKKPKNTIEKEDKHNDNDRYSTIGGVDLLCREPLYATTEESVNLWEASLFGRHVHPSVRAFQNGLSKDPHRIDFSGDPTVEFKLLNCINRFAYKNPKKDVGKRKGMRGDSASAKEQPLNQSDFMKLEADKVEPDLAFFHKFFGEQAQLRKEKRRKASRKGDDESDADSVASQEDLGFEADEEEIDRFADKLAQDMMSATAGSMGGADMDDIDMDDPDLDDMSDNFSDGEADKNEDENEDVGDSDHEDSDGTSEGEEEFLTLSDDEMEDTDPRGTKKWDKKRKKSSDEDIFASPDDFEEAITANLAYASASKGKGEDEAEVGFENGKKQKKAKKSKTAISMEEEEEEVKGQSLRRSNRNKKR